MNFVQNENEGTNQNKDQAGVAEDQTGQAGSALAGQKWYKCMYCNGGFSCAQALGGHMNAHRRERALRSRSSPAACDLGLGSSFPSCSLALSSSSYQADFSSLLPQLSTEPSREKDVLEKDCDRIHLNEYSELFHEKQEIKVNGEEMSYSQDDEEVDLELRLGQNPHKRARLSSTYFTIL
ncbi:hypothetical protein SUGI_0863010 [Cryptomeria japonica]|uniref:transcriptional regulator TAC1-like n=1 Tax=Cryptomeria japonica TaxID=3369 RepID=UPI0024147003|nr:transcriptional regulator TAC1-like [Cryptomeria japonica]GLJ41697.1 hypothetical protein SUGI_0863010 [Cryptomeria japonica]